MNSDPRFRLRHPVPVLRRSPAQLQLGRESGHAVVVDGLPQQAEILLRALARPHTLAELRRLAPQLTAEQVDWLLGALDSSGLLASPTDPTQVGVIGSGPLADLVADLLADSAETVVVSRIATGADPRPQSCGEGSTRATSGPWSTRAADWPGLNVIATAAAEPDRALTDALSRAGSSHLVVRLEPGRAVVGPYVVPGRTPCLRCLDLANTRADPAWPNLLAQLGLTRASPDRVLLAWAAATACAEVLCALEQESPATGGRSLELPAAGHAIQVREWGVHPECRCGAGEVPLAAAG